MGTIHVLTRDRSLGELITLELSAMGITSPSFGDAEHRIPADCLLLLVDLDTVKYPTGTPPHRTTVAVTRHESTHEALGFTPTAILHRPFPLTLLRDTVRRLLTEEEPTAAPQKKRHRVTARRSGKVSGLRLSPETNTLLVGNETVALTKSEYTVLDTLLRAGGEPVAREELARILNADGRTNLPDVHVCAIRKKLAPYGKEHVLRTVRGIGYAYSE